jgi:hypothetical protein
VVAECTIPFRLLPREDAHDEARAVREPVDETRNRKTGLVRGGRLGGPATWQSDGALE